MGGGWIEHRGEPCEMMRDGPESKCVTVTSVSRRVESLVGGES